MQHNNFCRQQTPFLIKSTNSLFRPSNITSSCVSNSPSFLSNSIHNFGQQMISSQVNRIPVQQASTNLYSSQTIIAPTNINKVATDPPKKTSRIRIQYIPYQTKEIVYDTIEKVELIPINKTTTTYENIKHKQIIPIQKAVTDFYAVQHITQFLPQTFSNKVIDYIKQQTIQQKVNYRPVDSKRIVSKQTPASSNILQSIPLSNMMQSMSGNFPNLQLTTSINYPELLGSQQTLMASTVSQALHNSSSMIKTTY